LDLPEYFEFLVSISSSFLFLVVRDGMSFSEVSKPTLSLTSMTPLRAGPTHADGTKRFIVGYLSGLDPWNLEIETFPRNAGDQDINRF
jgi:hypothetical protein